MNCRVTLVTAPNPGAVAILQLHGPDARQALQRLTGREAWDVGRLRLCRFADIDDGLAALLCDDAGQVMPHGGPRVVQRLLDRLRALGVAYDPEPDPWSLYPEADSPIEADMLHAMATAASPAALDLLAAQPHLWREQFNGERRAASGERSAALDKLIDPATVAVVGAPNVGKSTLLNALLGRTAAITADLPGVTRDYVGSLVDLDGVVVQWLDTPGLRDAADPVERAAIRLARRVVETADILIAMREPGGAFPADLPRAPDLRVVNKIDRPASPAPADDELPISAKHGHHLDALRRRVLETLGLADLTPRPWAFCPALRELLQRSDDAAWRAYLGV